MIALKTVCVDGVRYSPGDTVRGSKAILDFLLSDGAVRKPSADGSKAKAKAEANIPPPPAKSK